ncbi:MAG: ribulokinase [Cytophagaceae bacterium]|nr:ribulokinase [Cytophagaceae bacterium]|tara:strand:+ start:14270 stop:15967 length:1698 start_codon:yes stop_codon:yes gene_type:complete
MKHNKVYVIGVDFGTSSVRALLLDAHNGDEINVAEKQYPRFKMGLFCDASKNQFRQHPLDYIESFENVMLDLLSNVPQVIQQNIKAISIDTTGSTPIAIDKQGRPLALREEFKDNPNAMFFLWKDHTALEEASIINEYAAASAINYLKYSGGIYSSEWFWAKLLHVLNSDTQVGEALYSWVEHCDWMPFLLTGGNDVAQLKRSVCAAGHKALWAGEFGGYPPHTFFAGIDPVLANISDTMPPQVYDASEIAGKLSAEWAGKLNLSQDILIGIGALDAHMGAVGGEIAPGYLSKVMGTSTCDMLVVPQNDANNKEVVNGICGQVSGSIIPGMIGMEAGQSAFGDIYQWFKELLLWPVKSISTVGSIDLATAKKIQKELSETLLKQLSEKAAGLPIDEYSEFAIDWWNGRRTPDANQSLMGAIHNLNLGSDAVKIFRSLVEATCFGSRMIIDRFLSEGIAIHGLIGVGGVAKKSPLVAQMMADVTGMKIKIHNSDQTCALGACFFAATIAGEYANVQEAVKQLGQGFQEEYHPDMKKHELYNVRYERYKKLCHFIENETLNPQCITQ